MSTTSLLTGVAGEYFVATNASASRTVTIQCKTSRNKDKKWILNQKSENYVSENHFYVFVNLLSDFERPSYRIVPSKVVGEFTKRSHLEWLGGKSNNGKARKYYMIRNFTDKNNAYLDKGELLGI